ncbi:MAG: AMIN domain-containing protein [Acidobacteriia bacterium]|nr:AMIN domain-containing protein [Terriglobia bacterium]
MKLTTGILAMVMMAGGAWGQSPSAIDNTRNVTKSLPPTQMIASNAAQSAKPAPGSPAPAVKPAIILASKSTPSAAPAKPAAKPAPAPAASQNNKLERVNVVRKADDIQIEISSREAVTPRVSKLSSPARVVVELPETVMATPQNKIPVGSAGVKGVRIGMDGKTPPTTSVVVDLEQACAYELTPGPSDKFVLTLHTQGVAKSTPAPAPAKTSAPAAKPQTAAAKPVMAPPSAAPKVAAAAKAAAPAPKPTTQTAAPAAKTAAPTAKPAEAPKQQANASAPASKPAAAPAGKPGESPKGADAAKPKPEEKKWAMNGKRDPFFSPVVQQQGGSGCSTGKKCLEIGNINLRGVVKSDAGFIAVVTNNLNKAYFLRENDPVFNGYVVKITGDSVVFQETVQDKLGKPFTREVVKRIFTPAV